MASPNNIKTPITPSKDLDELRGRMNSAIALKREISRRWRRSPWRILPAPILAYTIIGTYYHWILHVEDAWFKAIAPVVVVLIFNITTPLVQSHWEQRTTKKILAEHAAEREKIQSETSSVNSHESS